MKALTVAGPVAEAAAAADATLEAVAPELVNGFRDHLPQAVDVVARRLVGAAYREGLIGGEERAPRLRRHAFDRVEVAQRLEVDPARLLQHFTDGAAGATAAEITDATVNLALAYSRRRRMSFEWMIAGARDSLDLTEGLDADDRCVFFERLATEGHNLHPCGRTRLGWSVPDLLAHDLESPGTTVGFVGVRRDVHRGDDIGRALLPDAALDEGTYAITPVHAWQLERVVRDRYADLVADRVLVPLDDTMPAVPTAALRTLLLGDVGGERRYLKLSLDIQVTSTRRTISVASTRNGPPLSVLLSTLLAGTGDRMMLMEESAGSATVVPDGRERDLAAIVRNGLSGRLTPGEVAVPGGALCAVSPVTGGSVVAELVNRSGRTALAFVEAYARLLLPPVLTLATRHGIALEAHLQNCVPTFVDGMPHRMALRDFAGLRVYPARLEPALELWPGSVIVTDDVDVMRAKITYTALQAHLGEIVVRLVESHGLDETAAWAVVRGVVDEVYDGLRGEEPVAGRAAEDHAFLTGRTLPHKALLTMRLAAARGDHGDIYVQVNNPLWSVA